MADEPNALPDPASPPVVPPAVPADAPVAEKRVRDQAPPSVHRSIWQSPFVQNVLPFATSLALHIGLIVVGIATAKAVQQVIKVVEEQIIIPDAQIIENADIGGVQNPGLGADPTRTSAQDQITEAMASANNQTWQQAPSQTLNQSLMGGGGSGDSSGDSLIGVGASTGTMGRGKGTGTGSGDGVGSGTGGGGGRAAAPFGLPGGGGGVGPKSPFMGISGNARKVIYICDGSGTMMSLTSVLKDELNKAVDILKPIQGFNIILFGDDNVSALNRQGLVLANPDNKRKASEFIDQIRPKGGTTPLPAIEMAFKQNPELIYILTDGFDMLGISYDELVAHFDRLNKDKKVRVNTILVSSRTEVELERVLQTIAEKNGGVYKKAAREN